MENQEIKIEYAEVIFPTDFLNRALSQQDNNSKLCLEWTGDMLFQTKQEPQAQAVKVHISSVLYKGHLKIRFDKLQFNFEEGIHRCSLNKIYSDSVNELGKPSLPDECGDTFWESGVNEKQTQTLISMGDKLFRRPVGRPPLLNKQNLIKIHSETLNSEKRKRGRPRKDKTLETRTGVLVNVLSDSAYDNIAFDVDRVVKIKQGSVVGDTGGNESPRKYGLRGVKLNAEIMKAVKRNVKNDEVDDGCTEETDENLYHATVLKAVRNDEDTMAKSNNSAAADSEELENYVDPSFEIAEHESLESDHEDSDYEMETHTSMSKKVRKNVNANQVKQHKKLVSKENFISLIGKSKRPYNKLDLGDVPTFERRKKRTLNAVFTCKICKKKLSDYTGVYEHAKKMHANKENIAEYLEELNKLKVEECGVCGMSFQDRWKLQSHEDREHKKNIPVSCFRCGRVLKNIQTLRNHIRWVHIQDGARHGLCHLCPASFRANSTLKQHIDEIHFGNKYFECDICNKRFYNRPQLKRHSRIHGLDESKRVFCKTCGKSFLFKCNLLRHIEAVHSQQSETFHCSYCGKGFGQKSGMVSHVQLVHFNLFPFSCKECKSTFARSTMLKEHMASFHKQPDFQITEKISKNSIYDKTEDDLFYCSYCSEGFRHKTKLVEHMHTDHSSAFPFSCKLCNQGFLEQTFLVIHNLKSHGILLENEDDIKDKVKDGKVGEILQIISTKAGYPNKVVSVQSNCEMVENDQEMEVLTSSDDTNLVAGADSQIIQTRDGATVMGTSSLLVEVESGSSTYRYLIEAPETLGEDGSVTVAQDIASLLLAAEQTIQEEGAITTDSQETTVQEINVVIDENNQIISAADKSGNLIPVSEMSTEAIEAVDEMNNTNTVQMDVWDDRDQGSATIMNQLGEIERDENEGATQGEDLLQLAAHETVNTEDIGETRGQISIGNFTVKYKH